ncbi:pyridoxamine 5'-phosphate oxidase family protein [Gaetbulibacter sp. M235]|uniref:pyridoxamine 5'-phosphate oxidase family protein n=1 Tax=Gaetbulibacter sp. M235 TaxID=3126510 RepID=UPI00374E4451
MSEDMVKKDCIQVLNDNYIAHLGYIFNNVPFITPITYYYDQKENIIISYSDEGHKISAMRLNPFVAFQLEEINSINNWKSVLIVGEFEELKGSEAKMQLHKFAQNVKSLIAKKETKNPESINFFSSKLNTGNIPIVYRIKVNEILGKQQLL